MFRADIALVVFVAPACRCGPKETDMFIKEITIEGVEGDVCITHIETGALVTCGNTILCEVLKTDSRETRFAKATEVARVICGQYRDRRTGQLLPNATNSMLTDVCDEIDRVAGC